LERKDGSMVKRILNRFLLWLRRRFGSHTFLILASIAVGIVSAIAAVILKLFVHLMHRIPDFFFSFSNTHIWYLLLPLAGIMLTVIFVKIFLQGKLEKGVGSILHSISRNAAKVEKSKMYTHVVTSGITVGLGGSAGLEAPIVVTGSAIGSNIATFLKLRKNERTLLLACGAASGIAAVFNSPIAGVVFAIEVLLTDISISMFIPLLISTASAIIVSKFLYSGQLFYPITNEWNIRSIPFYIVLGLLCGFISVYMTRVTLLMENFFDTKRRIFPKALWGGLVLGALIFLFPPLFGEGFVTITSLFHGDYRALVDNSIFSALGRNPWLLLSITAAIIFIKVIATSLTLGSGGNGGIYAPSLFTGSLVGFGLAFFVNTTGLGTLHISNFIAVGMAGIMAGVIHAPLTAIFLIAEITGGYVLFVPLMIVSALSFFISRYFEPYTIYTKNLVQRGHFFTDDRDSNVLMQMDLGDLIETEFIPLQVTAGFPDVIEAFTRSKRNIFPVVDDENNFVGLIDLDDIKELMFKPEVYRMMTVSDVTITGIITIDKTENVISAIKKLESSGHWNIPVTEGTKYIGFISRSNLLSYYRRILKRSASLF
jgi:chloride channel protein, CIC family